MKNNIDSAWGFIVFVVILGICLLIIFGKPERKPMFKIEKREKIFTYDNVEKVGEGTGKTTKSFGKGFFKGLFSKEEK